MIRYVFAITCALGAFLAFAFAPALFGADIRRAGAVMAIQAGAAPMGVALLRPLAAAGDAGAQNDLGVLLNRGIGAQRDPVEAARLLNTAASAGLRRAQMNLLLIRAPCDTQYGPQTTTSLEAFAREGDRRAASFVADCLTWSADLSNLAGTARRLLSAAEIATRTGDADEELKFGRVLLQHTKDLKGWNAPEATLRATALASTDYLFRASAQGRASAFEGIGILARDFIGLLESDPLAEKVRARQPSEWIDLAAQAGQPKSQCTVGVRLATEMTNNPAAVTSTNRARFEQYFQACLKSRNPRQVIFREGREQTLGHDPLFDIWMREDPFLIISPRYENYDHDIVGREDAVHRMAELMRAR